MNTNQLKYLIEISKQSSLSAASKKLHISHTGLSHAIIALEEELGAELLIRSKKGVILTDKAKQLITISQNFFNDVNAVFPQKHQKIEGNINFIAPIAILEYLLFDIIVELEKNHHNVRIVHQIENNHEQLIRRIHTDHNLFGFCYLNLSPEIMQYFEKYNLVIKTYYSSSQFCVCTPEHPLAKYKTVSIKELEQYHYIGRFSNLAFSDDVSTNALFEENAIFYEKRILNGKSYSICLELPIPPFSYPYIKDTVRIKISDALPTSLCLIYHKKYEMSEATAFFLNTFLEKING